jgi:1,4-dihydroxy-6-naphthoate synthase
MKISLGHSPDPDDAFMFYGIASGRISEPGLEFEQILLDIESLNRRAIEEQIDVTAVSFHAYAYLSDKYVLLPHGASFGDGYGPIVVSREPLEPGRLRGLKIAIPGKLTSAHLALRLYQPEFDPIVVPFDQIPEAVVSGKAAAGLLIHEGQLTYARSGLHNVVDLGAWWKEQTGLPLPLGGNAIRRALGAETIAAVSRTLRASIAFGLDHRAEALTYAEQFGRGLERPLADRFVGMYVNDWTLDYGARGREAVRTFLNRGRAAGLITVDPRIDFAGETGTADHGA